MSFLYPRTIAVRRAPLTLTAGVQSYQTPARGAETVIASGVPANIQLDRIGVRPDAHLPSDTPGQPTYRVFTPRNALRNGTIQDGDLIEDDQARRFQVTAAYDNSMGGAHRVQRLRT